MSEIETRVADPCQVEVRAGSVPRLTGYAARFGVLSHDLGGFREKIDKRAFAAALKSKPDVLARVEHENGFNVVGRTTNGTLTLDADENGLRYVVTPPDTQAGRDIVTLVREGFISESSFAFSLPDEDSEAWDFTTSPPTRTILKANLHDVAPVARGAYPQTSLEARARAGFGLQRARSRRILIETLRLRA